MTSAPRPPSASDPGQIRFGAYLMLTVGVLLTVFCGGCTLLILGPVAFDLATSKPKPDVAGLLLLYSLVPLLLGGVPAAGGIVLILQGRAALKKANAASRTAAAQSFD